MLDRIERDRAWATPTLDGELARANLDDRDRRLAAELVYGVLRHRTRIGRALTAHAKLKSTPPRILTILRVAAYQLLLLDRVPGYAAIDDAVTAARDVAGAKLAGFCNAVLRKVANVGEPVLPLAPQARIEVEFSLPAWIAEELSASAGDRFAEIAGAFAQSAPLIARANLRRTTRDALIAELAAVGVTATPVAGAPMALRIDGQGDPSRSASFLAGRWTVQDTGAQMVGIVAAPVVGQRILDACAGVGDIHLKFKPSCWSRSDADVDCDVAFVGKFSGI